MSITPQLTVELYPSSFGRPRRSGRAQKAPARISLRSSGGAGEAFSQGVPPEAPVLGESEFPLAFIAKNGSGLL